MVDVLHDKLSQKVTGLADQVITGEYQYRRQKKLALQQARPILEKLVRRFPPVDVRYCFWLLARLIDHVEPLRNPALLRAWEKLKQDYTRFLKSAEAFRLTIGGLEQIQAEYRAAEQEACREGKRIVWYVGTEDLVKDWTEPISEGLNRIKRCTEQWFEGLSRIHGLGIAPRERGRTSYPWIDSVVWCLAEHFEKTTLTPQWRTIGQILDCVSLPRGFPSGFSGPRQIRQRLVRWKRIEERGGQDPGLEHLGDKLRRVYAEQFGRSKEQKRSKRLDAHIRRRLAEVEKKVT